ncbi:hypothetical protein K1719_039469 [Acacia pycnantha]|nr:hypothetical protein K1719_039469 [Acacia pycnantha]
MMMMTIVIRKFSNKKRWQRSNRTNCVRPSRGLRRLNRRVRYDHRRRRRVLPSSTFHQKIHECPVCFRVFASGQALGGNKRTHLTGSSTLLPTRASTKLVGKFIDLNLPLQQWDEDDIGQIDN